jgi:parvulin-like peptidyl-prolyl isomerase
MDSGIYAMKRHALSLALVVALAPGLDARTDILEQILVKVNGDIITKTDLEQRQIAALRQADPNFRPGNDAELRKALSAVTPEVIVNAVDELLLVQRGRELGYALGNEQFGNIVDNIKKENKLETEEAFQAALKQEGLTLEDLRKQLERQMLISRVQQVEVQGKIAVSEEEVKQFYDTSKQTFTTQPQLTLREVLVTVPTSEKGVNVAEDDAARARAEAIHKRLAAGEDFAKLASDISDSPSKANGGLIGPISQSDLSPELLKEIDPLKVGQITRVLRTTRGYQIIKLETATPMTVKTLDEARAEIADKIAAQKQRGQMRLYLQQLRAQAIIDWKNEEVKKAFDVGVKMQAEAAPTQ